jgi:hypothetical protein
MEISEGVFSLGTTNMDGKIAQSFLFVRYQQNFSKPPRTPGVRPDKDKDTTDSRAHAE